MDPPSFFKLLTESCVTWQKCVFTFQPLSSARSGSKGGSHLLNTKRRVSTHISMWEHSYQKQTQSLGWRIGTSLCCVSLSYFPELLSPGIFLLLMFLGNIKKPSIEFTESWRGVKEGVSLDVINLAAAVVMMRSACNWNICGTLEDETKAQLTGTSMCLLCTEEHKYQLC